MRALKIEELNYVCGGSTSTPPATTDEARKLAETDAQKAANEYMTKGLSIDQARDACGAVGIAADLAGRYAGLLSDIEIKELCNIAVTNWSGTLYKSAIYICEQVDSAEWNYETNECTQ